MNNHYRNIQASLLRFCSDFADEIAPLGYGLTSVNLDAKATPQEWPNQNFIGVSETQYDFDEHEIHVALAFVISTVEDKNLFCMDEIVNRLVDKVIIGTRIPIYDAITNLRLGHLVAKNGLRVGAVANTVSQPAKPVFVRLVSDQMLAGPV